MHAYIDLPALIVHQPASRRTIMPSDGNNVSSMHIPLLAIYVMHGCCN